MHWFPAPPPRPEQADFPYYALLFLELSTDIVFQVVLFRLLFKLILRDLLQLFLIRGYKFSDETGRDWKHALLPCWPTKFGADGKARSVAVGMWMRRM